MNYYQEALFPAPTEKYCYVCKRILPDENFAKNSTKSGEVRPECRECDNKQRKERKQREKERDPDAWRDKYLKKTYGISLQDYNEMVTDQGGLCWICEQESDLVVDHDHETEKVRGLLCNLCNTSLGGFKDNIGSLEKAIKYLVRDIDILGNE